MEKIEATGSRVHRWRLIFCQCAMQKKSMGWLNHLVVDGDFSPTYVDCGDNLGITASTENPQYKLTLR